MNLNAEMIEGFSELCLAKHFDGRAATPQFHKDLWKLCCSDHPQVAISAPRGHAKSTSITHTYLLACLLFRVKKYALIVANTENLARKFLFDIKQELLDNEDVISMFGVEKLVKDTETEILVKMADGHKFRIMCLGVGQSPRGTKIDRSRPDLLICDDLEDDEQVLNPDRREKFRYWFYGALLPALASDNPHVRIVGTILHADSLLERLMPQENRVKGTKIIDDGLKQISTDTNPAWLSVRFRAHTPNFSKILWPEKFSKETLERKKQEYTDQGMPQVYAQEYLNHPIDESTAFFKRADLLPFRKGDKEKELRKYAAIDFAISDKQRSDYTVIAVVGVDEAGIIYVLDVWRGRWDAKEIIDNMLLIQKRYKPDLFTAEAGMIQKALGPFLYEQMQKEGVYINLNPMVPLTDKQSRARSLQARLRAGTVRFNHDADWFPDLENELLTFPRSAHDDQVDALSWTGLTLDQLIPAMTLQEMEDEAWEEEYRESYEDMGRSEITGY